MKYKMGGVSIVIPAYNAERTLSECLESALALKWQDEIEVIVVNDGSSDSSSEMAASFPALKVIDVPHGGAAAATNIGIKAAHHEMVVLLEADVVLQKDWLEKINPSFDDPSVAAVGGCAVTANSSIIGRIAGYDVESRQSRAPMDADHLPNTNTACRREALLEVGLLNESLSAGYDVDLGRRLKAVGYRLILRKDIACKHYWKDDIKGYLRQQYNYACYRMELARPLRKPHDQVTSLWMILQVPFTIVLLLASIIGYLVFPLAPLLLLLLPAIHLPQALSLLRVRKETCVLFLPLLFIVRNLCWSWAALVWVVNRFTHGYVCL